MISESYDYGKGWTSERQTRYVATNSKSVEDLRKSIECCRKDPYLWQLVVDAENPAVYLGEVVLPPDLLKKMFGGAA
jgi:hypothetical protein